MKQVWKCFEVCKKSYGTLLSHSLSLITASSAGGHKAGICATFFFQEATLNMVPFCSPSSSQSNRT